MVPIRGSVAEKIVPDARAADRQPVAGSAVTLASTVP